MQTHKRILFAEDSERDIEMALEAFSDHKLAPTVEVARDGVEALDYLYCRGRYDGRRDDLPVLLLLDLKMPRMGGLEALKQIKSDPQLKGIPVVVMTSSLEEQDFIRSQKLGAVSYIFKPIRFESFLDSTKQLEISCVPSSDRREFEMYDHSF